MSSDVRTGQGFSSVVMLIGTLCQSVVGLFVSVQGDKTMYFQNAMIPRNGKKLVAILGARISGCGSQKEVSLEDQIDHGKEVVGDVYDGKVEFIIIATTGKGERLDRPELEELERRLRQGGVDLVVYEDAGRLIRGADAVRLFGIAVDCGARCIAPNDAVDTWEPNWEKTLLNACAEHVGHNEHTSRRLKQKLMNRFRKSGGARATLPYGYSEPEKGDTYFDVQKDPAAEEHIREGFDLLDKTLNYSAVARYFNVNSVPVGPGCFRSKKWNRVLVKGFYRNPLLVGKPQRGKMVTAKHHETGRRRPVKNSEGPITIDCPHLAYFEQSEIDEVFARLDAKNNKLGRKCGNGGHFRNGSPRKTTRFPGQFGTCWYCGSHFVWGGNGQPHTLMCARSRDYQCWNSVSFSGSLFVDKMMSALLDQLTQLDGFEDQFREIVTNVEANSSIERELKALRNREANLEQKRKNFKDAIEKYGPQDMFDEQIEAIVKEDTLLRAQRFRLESSGQRSLKLPSSTTELRELMQTSVLDLSRSSDEFNRILRQIVPEFHIYLVRLCDGGHLLPRAQVCLDLSGIVPDARFVDGLPTMLSSTVTLDLFEAPQRERIREQAVELIAAGHTQRDCCSMIEEQPTQPALQKALVLQKEMERLGLDSPYVLVTEPPEDYAKLRRHKNPQYSFNPVEGYSAPELLWL